MNAPAPPPPASGAAAHAATVAPGAWALRGLFVIGLVLLLREARVLLAPVLIAVVLTFVLAPPVRALQRRFRVPEYIGAGLLVAALLLSVVPLGASLAEPAAQWWERAPQTAAQLFEKLDRLRAAVPGLAPPPRRRPSPRRPTRAAPAAAPRRPRRRPRRRRPIRSRSASPARAWR